MSLITRERNGLLIQKVLEMLEQSPDGLQARVVIERLSQTIPLTDHEKGYYLDGSLRFNKILRFSTIWSVKAGWRTKTKGIWQITDYGKAVLKKIKDPTALFREADRLYKEWKLDQDTDDENVEAEAEVVGRSGVLEEAEEISWQEIQTHIHKLNAYDFQNMVAALLRAMNYHVDWVAPPGKDDGVDIVAFADPLGAKVPRIKVQVKHRATTKVTLDELKSFLAGLGNQDVGIYVSTGGFTLDAAMKARAQEQKQITLIALEKSFDLWVEHYERVEDSARYYLPLKPIYYLAPKQ